MADRELIRRSFLGTGWSFPPEFRPSGGTGVDPAGHVLMTSGKDDVEASLRILFGTLEGERFLEPWYGLNMHERLFDSMTTTMRTYLEDRIRRTLLVYEARISDVVVNVDARQSLEGRLLITLDYTIQETNSRYNFVYPFYLHEANEVRAREANVTAATGTSAV